MKIKINQKEWEEVTSSLAEEGVASSTREVPFMNVLFDLGESMKSHVDLGVWGFLETIIDSL